MAEFKDMINLELLSRFKDKVSELLSSETAALKSKIDAVNTYSETPRKIGTWIDGKDVYRIAFQQEISGIDRGEKSVSLGDLIRTSDCFVIGAFAMVNKTGSLSVTDDYGTNFNGNTFSWDTDNAALIYGYVDYVKTR